MLGYREQFGVEEWSDFEAVRGIGPSKISSMIEFAEKSDPFDIELTARTLDEIRHGIRNRLVGFRGLPIPTHRSDEIPRDRECVVTFLGVVRAVEYKDLIEDQRAQTGDSVEDIIARTKDAHLVKSCNIHCIDDGDDEVY